MRSYRKRNAKLREHGYPSYQAYLASPEWRSLRLLVLERDGGKCVACGNPASCVHHTKYSRNVLLATQPTPALVSLCNPCHEFIEFDRGGKVRMAHTLDRLRWRCRMHGRSLPGRCPKCMKGTPPKGMDLCRSCRRDQARCAAGTTVSRTDATATAYHRCAMFTLPSGKHKGKTLDQLTDSSLHGVRNAYNGLGGKWRHIVKLCDAEITRRVNAGKFNPRTASNREHARDAADIDAEFRSICR